ncbi:beta-glucuronidase [Catenibacillus scindens]|uniref:Beta-glucuronidase n=2 Tax=Catenibacillus scindens TaxID=673271 RepID=A0A7W8HBE2_9FIRM|nr:beta-glucuronidase [Catenibacillus scindens]MBB5265366.1 beta-glucuronidase [Catenibacillus scindens]
MLFPVLTESRCVIDLSGTWNFKADACGVGFKEMWYASRLRDARTMPVPAAYNDMKEDAALREHYGWVFYQRNVSVPAALKSQRVVLRMEAVAHKARVYFNGRLLCEHKGGFLPFETELGEVLKPGENLLTIAVDNRIDRTTLPVGGDCPFGTSEPVKDQKQNYPRFDFFNYAGIIRPVKIYTTPKDYICDVTLVPSVIRDKDLVRASVDYCVKLSDLTIDVDVEVYDADGKRVGCGHGLKGQIDIENPHLWNPGDGYMYQARITAGEDVYVQPFGIRSVRVDGGRFLINEKPFYFKGYGKHEDTFPAGRGFNPVMNAKDISLMQWQGANSFRTSHYPYSEEMMRLCDREGIVVIDETPAVGVSLKFGGGISPFCKDKVTYKPFEDGGIGTFEHHREVIRDLIDRDKNHPCVVMWSLANEPDSDSPGAYEYFKPLFDLARACDPQKRPCTIVCMKGAYWKEDVTIRLSDVICLNRYYGWYDFGGELETAKEELKKEMDWWDALGKPVMMTEYGADTVEGLRDTLPVMFTEEYQVAYYKMNHQVFDTLKNFVGEQAWNFADFATCQGTGRVQGNKKGIFTRDRRPKMIAHYLKERWENIPDFGYKG